MLFRTLPFFLIILLLAGGSIPAKSQRFGLPGIQNYARSEYKGGTQNWSLAQAGNGMMYFANNDGLVEFDGAHWSIY